MKSFIIYNPQGAILRTGSCPDVDYALQCGANELIIEGVADDRAQCVVDGVVVDKPAPDASVVLAQMWIEVRAVRDGRLTMSDWTQTADSPLTAEQRSEWQMYRQALRDLPADYSYATSLEQVTFPDIPS